MIVKAAAGALLIAASIVVHADNAQAFSFGTCKKSPVSAEGGVRRGEHNAMRAAIAAWQQKTRKMHGSRFADYGYSGDRSISCTWDANGVTYRCRATALPCG